jgi:hypothetical protein
MTGGEEGEEGRRINLEGLIMHESEGGQSSSYFLQFKDSAKQKKLNF